jgi:hypothetical protein
MRKQSQDDDPVSKARKQVVHCVRMVLGLSVVFCLLLAFGIWQGSAAFMIFESGGRYVGMDQPLMSLLTAVGLATCLFLWELHRSWYKYQAIQNQQPTATQAEGQNAFACKKKRLERRRWE